MKKYKYITLALVAMISFNSCNDFLTTELTDPKKTVDTYYKTPAEANTALAGCYNGLNLIWSYNVAFPLASEVLSDNCFGGTGASDGYGYQMLDEFNKSISTSDNSLFGTNWKNYYQAIYRCNVLLSKLDQVKWDSTSVAQNLKAQYKGEAKFIRAFCYFDMVRLWEKVPLVTNPTLDNVPQTDPAITYAQIMSDLRFASDSLPSASYTTSVSGRVTKWAAESLLARVYLFYSGYYATPTIGGETAATALAAVEDVIAHSGHGLVTDFTTLWPAASKAKKVLYAGETNKEVVFSIKYSSTNGTDNITGNEWMVMTGMREESHFPYQYGWGACTVDPKLYNTFDPTDARRFASITSIVDEKLAFTKASKNREYTGYYLKKFSPMCDSLGVSIAPDFQYGQYQDYFSIRYADVLLMAAELGSPSAASYYNLVHQRAIPAAVAVTSVTKEDILAERRLEFVGEGIRYWDLLRQGINTAAQIIVNNTTISLMFNNKTVPTAEEFKANIIATRGFQQIPNDQITLSSGVLKQNAGW